MLIIFLCYPTATCYIVSSVTTSALFKYAKPCRNYVLGLLEHSIYSAGTGTRPEWYSTHVFSWLKPLHMRWFTPGSGPVFVRHRSAASYAYRFETPWTPHRTHIRIHRSGGRRSTAKAAVFREHSQRRPTPVFPFTLVYQFARLCDETCLYLPKHHPVAGVST